MAQSVKICWPDRAMCLLALAMCLYPYTTVRVVYGQFDPLGIAKTAIKRKTLLVCGDLVQYCTCK